jgi:hypothetical protein
MLMGILFAGILAQQDQGGGGMGIVGTLIYLAVVVFLIAALWKVFTKAGKPGWAAIIPIYNVIVLLEIVGRPWWWFLLMFIPVVNFVIGIIVMIDLAKSFGKGVGFGIGLLLLGFIFIPILGFGSAQYVGPAAAQGSPAMA